MCAFITHSCDTAGRFPNKSPLTTKKKQKTKTKKQNMIFGLSVFSESHLVLSKIQFYKVISVSSLTDSYCQCSKRGSILKIAAQ